MKNLTLFIALMITALFAWSQKTDHEIRIPLLGEPAPAFEANSTNGVVKFPFDYMGKWKIIFSHPADFTPVCSSEIIELAFMQEDFDKLNTSILVLSTDGIHSHIEWVKSLESMTYKETRCPKIKFPLIADESLIISKMYGMLHPSESDKRDIRGVFIIDPENKIQAIYYYPMTIGRNMEEIKRTLVALQTHEKHNVFTPANWNPGQQVLLPSPSSIKEAEKLESKNDPDLQKIDWYMWLKKL